MKPSKLIFYVIWILIVGSLEAETYNPIPLGVVISDSDVIAYGNMVGNFRDQGTKYYVLRVVGYIAGPDGLNEEFVKVITPSHFVEEEYGNLGVYFLRSHPDDIYMFVTRPEANPQVVIDDGEIVLRLDAETLQSECNEPWSNLIELQAFKNIVQSVRTGNVMELKNLSTDERRIYIQILDQVALSESHEDANPPPPQEAGVEATGSGL